MATALNAPVLRPQVDVDSLSRDLRTRQQCIAEITEMIHVTIPSLFPVRMERPSVGLLDDKILTLKFLMNYYVLDFGTSVRYNTDTKYVHVQFNMSLMGILKVAYKSTPTDA